MKRSTPIHAANLLLFVFGVLLFVCGDASTRAAHDALVRLGTRVLPSLFPFMILSDLIVRRGLLSPLSEKLPMRRLFGLPANAGIAFLLGGLCGFPMGAKTVCGLYTAGELKKEEGEQTIALSNNTGPGFTVEAAGAVLWGSRGFGWYLYFAQLLSAVLLGIVFRPGKGKENTGPHTAVCTEPPIRSLLAAVRSSALAMVPLSGYIVFFSVLTGIAESPLPWEELGTLCACLLEFTAGVEKSASLGGSLGRFLTGFAVGFSGVSVFVQSYHFTAEAGLSLRRALWMKGLQGCITGGLCILYPIIFP